MKFKQLAPGARFRAVGSGVVMKNVYRKTNLGYCQNEAGGPPEPVPSDQLVEVVPNTEAPATPEREFTGRRKIDDIVCRLMNDGTLTIEEGLAIGAAVRWVARKQGWSGMDRHAFRQKYGEIALDGAGMLMEAAK